jgi:hypothetical protein
MLVSIDFLLQVRTWHLLVKIPLDHEATVTHQFLSDTFNENNLLG